MSLLEAIRKRRGLKTSTELVVEANKVPEGCEFYEWNAFATGSGVYGRLSRGGVDHQFTFLCLDAFKQFRLLTCLSLFPIRVKNVACGAAHNLAVTEEGSLLTWGKCHYGQLGHGDQDIDRWLPTKVEAFAQKKVVEIGCGVSSSYAIVDHQGTDSKNTVYAWGCGFYGTLGHRTEANIFLPKAVDFFLQEDLPQVIKIEGGMFHTGFLTETRELFVCGKNEQGQLGLPFNNHSNCIPTRTCQQLGKLMDFSCGKFHTVLIDTQKKPWGFGSNRNQQLGRSKQPSFVDTAIPLFQDAFDSPLTAQSIAAGAEQTLVLTSTGEVFQLGFGDEKEKHVERDSGSDKAIVQIQCGANHCMAIDTEGTLCTWGRQKPSQPGNHFGLHSSAQLSTMAIPEQSFPSKPKTVVGGSNHTLVLLETPSSRQKGGSNDIF